MDPEQLRYICAMHGYIDFATNSKSGKAHVRKTYGKDALAYWKEDYDDAKQRYRPALQTGTGVG